MIRSAPIRLIALAPALLLLGCATPEVVETEAPPPKIEKPAETAAAVEEPVPLPADFDDGIRLPDERLLSMPGDGDFRPTVPDSPLSLPGPGSVTVRPPTDPPVRPKPADSEAQ